MSTHRPAAPLVRQLMLPTVGLVLAAVVANVGFAAWLAVRRAREAARGRQEQVARALEDSRVAVSPQVLDTLRRLTGSHFIVWDAARRAAGLATLPQEAVDAGTLAALVADGGGTATVAGASVHVGLARSTGVRPETVLVLTPVRGIWATTLDAAWPVLAVGVATLAVLVPLGLATTARLSRQIATIERHVDRIAGGDFGATLATFAAEPPAAAAEIERLGRGVDSLSTTLAALRSSLVAGERQRLLGQLAAGFAHELRNAITGARLAIDLHRRRCHAGAEAALRGATAGSHRASVISGDDSLDVASQQLDIVAAEIRGLLALGRPDTSAPVAVDVAALVGRVADLVGLRCTHAGVRLEQDVATDLFTTGHPEALRAALVNLMLNAIDAAGSGGLVRLVATRLRTASGSDRVALTVEDDGPGPPAALAEILGEPFVTGKPEGVGLGLAVARAVAEQHAGTLDWSRVGGRTRFTLTLSPVVAAAREVSA